MDKENFPIVTFLLTALILACFLIPSTSEIYERLSFVPSSLSIFTIYSFFTYTFLHIDWGHLIGNLVLLLIAGWILEEGIGKKRFLLIYFTSGCIAAIFEVLSRVMLNFSMDVPFVGASGAVAGLLAAASLLKPTDKISTLFIILMIFPLMLLVFDLPIFTDNMLKVSVMVLSGVIIVILWFLGQDMPLFVVVPIFLIYWFVSVLAGFEMDVSNMGHIGGALGGMLIFFILPKEKET